MIRSGMSRPATLSETKEPNCGTFSESGTRERWNPAAASVRNVSGYVFFVAAILRSPAAPKATTPIVVNATVDFSSRINVSSTTVLPDGILGASFVTAVGTTTSVAAAVAIGAMDVTVESYDLAFSGALPEDASIVGPDLRKAELASCRHDITICGGCALDKSATTADGSTEVRSFCLSFDLTFPEIHSLTRSRHRIREIWTYLDRFLEDNRFSGNLRRIQAGGRKAELHSIQREMHTQSVYFEGIFRAAAIMARAPFRDAAPPMNPLACANTASGTPQTAANCDPLRPRQARGNGSRQIIEPACSANARTIHVPAGLVVS